MNQPNQASLPTPPAHKLDWTAQQWAEWQLCLTTEDESWHCLQQRHRRQRQEWQSHASNGLTMQQLLDQQLQDVQAWHQIMARYRQKVKTGQAPENLDLTTEKSALGAYLSA